MKEQKKKKQTNKAKPFIRKNIILKIVHYLNFFYSELKRRLKNEQKAKEKEEKASTKAAAAPEKPAAQQQTSEADEENIDPNVNE